MGSESQSAIQVRRPPMGSSSLLLDDLQSESSVFESPEEQLRTYRHKNLTPEAKRGFLDRLRSLLGSPGHELGEEQLDEFETQRQTRKLYSRTSLVLLPSELRKEEPEDLGKTSQVLSHKNRSGDSASRNSRAERDADDPGKANELQTLFQEIARVKGKLNFIEKAVRQMDQSPLLKECETVSFNISEIESSFKDFSEHK